MGFILNMAVVMGLLSGTCMGPDGVVILAEALQAPTGLLRHLVLDKNQLSKNTMPSRHFQDEHKPEDLKGITALAGALRINTTLHSLSLKGCSLGPMSASALATTMSTISTLGTLFLDSNQVC